MNWFLTAVLCLVGMVGAAYGQAGMASDVHNPSLVGTFVARIDLAIDAEGGVEQVAASGEFPDAVKQIIEKRAASWRFSPMLWQGKPVSTRITRFLRLRLAPTTSGGYALQLLGWADGYYVREYTPPPMLGNYEAVGKHVTYAYLATVSEEGKVGEVTSILPDKHSGQQSKAYSRRVAVWLPDWRIAPILADGKPVTCQRIYVHEHAVDRIGTHLRNDAKGWADEIDPAQLPAQDAQRLQHELDKLQGACHMPLLQTRIDNVVL